MSWKNVQDKLKGRDLDAEFEKFLNESLSDESAPVSPRTKQKTFVEKGLKNSEREKPWWAEEEDVHESPGFQDAVRKSWLKSNVEKQAPIFEQQEEDRKRPDETAIDTDTCEVDAMQVVKSSMPAVSMSKDSLEETSRPSTQLKGTLSPLEDDNDDQSENLESAQLENSTTYSGLNSTATDGDGIKTAALTTTDQDMRAPGLETLEEYHDKQAFFADMLDNATGTVDYSELNRKLDAESTLRDQNLGSLTDFANMDQSLIDKVASERDKETSYSIDDDSEPITAKAADNAVINNTDIAQNDKSDDVDTIKVGMLDKVGLMESLDSTTGLRDALRRELLKEGRGQMSRPAFPPTQESPEVLSADENTLKDEQEGSNNTVHGTTTTAREIAELQRALLEAKTLSSQNINRQIAQRSSFTAKHDDGQEDKGNVILLQKNIGEQEQALFDVKPMVSDPNQEPVIVSSGSALGHSTHQLSFGNQWKGVDDLNELERSLQKITATRDSENVLGMYQSNSSEMLLRRIMEDQETIEGDGKEPSLDDEASDGEDSPPTDSLRSIKAIAEARKKSVRVQLETAVSQSRDGGQRKKKQVKKKQNETKFSTIKVEKTSKRVSATPSRSTPKTKPLPTSESKRKSLKKAQTADVVRQVKPTTPSGKGKRQSYRAPRSNVSSVSELAASVESFAGYLREFRDVKARPQSSPIKPTFKDDEPAVSKSFSRQQANKERLLSLSREKSLQKELCDMRDALEEEKKKNERLTEEVAAIDRKWKRKQETMKIEADKGARDLQQEIFVLKSKLKVAENQTESRPSKDETDADTEKLLAEIKEQEALLDGYHKENERLYEDMKRKTEQAKAIESKMFDENQKLALKIRELKEKLVLTERRSGDESSNTGTNRIIQLQNQVQFYQEREQQFKDEIKALEGEKELLETRLRNMEKEKYAIRGAGTDEKLKESEERHAAEIAKLQKRIDWLIENQELVDSDRTALKKKTEEVKDLRILVERLQKESQTSDKADSKGGKLKQEDVKRIRDLERQVKEMEAIIRKRYPNSLPALIYAAASVAPDTAVHLPPQEESVKTRMFLEKSVRKLEAELEAKDLDHARALRAVEQRYTAMQAQYDDYIRSLERNIKEADDKSTLEDKTKTRLLEDKYQNQLVQSEGKISELQEEVRALKTELLELRQKASSVVPRKAGKHFNTIKETETVPSRKYLDMIAEKDSKIERLETALDEFMLRTAQPKNDNRFRGNAIFQEATWKPSNKIELKERAVSPIPFSFENEDKPLYEKEVVKLRRELEHAQLENAETKVKLNRMVAEKENDLQRAFAKTDETLEDLIKKHEQEIERIKVDFALNHSSSKVAELSNQIASQEIVIQHLKTKEMEATADKELLAASRVREESLKNQLRQMKADLDQARQYQSPEMHHFRQLESKILLMENKHAEREQELERIIDTTKLAASVEAEEIEQKWKDILHQKNNEIELFRKELDSILQVLQELQRQGVVLSIKTFDSR